MCVYAMFRVAAVRKQNKARHGHQWSAHLQLDLFKQLILEVHEAFWPRRELVSTAGM